MATAGLPGLTAVAALAQAPSLKPAMQRQAGLNNGDDHVSLPPSNNASDIVPADTTSDVAPTLPSPGLSGDAGTGAYLRSARDARAAGHTGEAQHSLEMAETWAPGGGVAVGQPTTPNDHPRIAQIREPDHAPGSGDNADAAQIIDLALMN
jgi:hypothetical protein